MNAPNITYLWTKLIVEELTRCGVTKFCISPGSRNTPLVISAAEHKRAETVICLDERAAAYYAVGYAKACGTPAALICTSGTAAANYLPAVVEAFQSATPLILLTADRPESLRGTGSNQTIDQVRIYGKFCRYSVDLQVPSVELPREFVLNTVDDAVRSAIGTPVGPVHINCQFAEPLTPENDNSISVGYCDGISGWHESSMPFTDITLPYAEVDTDIIAAVKEKIATSKRGVIVIGNLGTEQGAVDVDSLSRNLRMPVLACVTSGLRFRPMTNSNVISHYDIYLRDSGLVESLRLDFILQLGWPVVSKALLKYTEETGATRVIVSELPFIPVNSATNTIKVSISPGEFCSAIADVVNLEDSRLLEPFKLYDSLCKDTLNKIAVTGSITNEFAIAQELLRALPDRCGLFLANSMPVRDADGSGIKSARTIRIGVNRGASGIDGNIASAVGYACGLRQRTVLLIGDLAFLHDLNSLLFVKRSQYPVTIVLVNNNGGGIFSFLPIAEQTEYFEEYFGTPHTSSFRNAALLYDLEYYAPKNTTEFRNACAESLSSDRSSIIEVKTDRYQNVEEHRNIWEAVTNAFRTHIRQS